MSDGFMSANLGPECVPQTRYDGARAAEILEDPLEPPVIRQPDAGSRCRCQQSEDQQKVTEDTIRIPHSD